MSYVVTAQAILLTLISILVVGLLRSHALILRDLGLSRSEPTDDGQQSPSPSRLPIEERGTTLVPAAEPGEAVQQRPVDDIVGYTLDLEPTVWSISNGQPSLVAFLSSGCLGCATFWSDLEDRSKANDLDARIVIVTKDRAEENLSKLHSMAGRLPVIMSSSSWESLEVPGSPYFVLVDGKTRRIVGAGSANDWEQMRSLVADFLEEVAFERLRSGKTRGRQRVELENELLAASGVRPDDESLYAPPVGESLPQ